MKKIYLSLLAFVLCYNFSFGQDLVCNDHILVSIDDCTDAISVDNLLENPNDSTPYVIELWNESETTLYGSSTDGTLNFDSLSTNVFSLVDKDLVYKVGFASGNHCWGNITFENKAGSFDVDCVNDTIYCTDPILAKVDSFYKHALPTFSGSDCYDIASVVVKNVTFKRGGCSDLWSGGSYERLIEVTNTQGQKTSCTQSIFVKTPKFSELLTNISDNVKRHGCDDSDAEKILGSFNLEFAGQEITEDNLCNITTTYSDERFNACKGAKIRRTWTITNLCSGVSRNFDQTIVVDDIKAPVLKSTELTAGVSAYECTGQINLKDIYTDGCSAISSIAATYVQSSGYAGSGSEVTVDALNGYVTGLAVGQTHTIQVQATDECGNKSEKEYIKVTVADNQPPVVVINRQLNVTLGSDGTGHVTPEMMDEGSYDACGIDYMEIRRVSGCLDTSAWSRDFVKFACCDIDAGTVTVELRVVDLGGKSSTTWADVLVEDGIAIEIECAEDVTISCTDFNAAQFSNKTYNAPSLTGSACGQGVDTSFTMVNNVECGEGTFTRTWTYTRGGSKPSTATCTQVITVTPTNDWKVTFPEDKSATCLEELPNADHAIVEKSGCEKIYVVCDTTKELGPDGACGRYRIDYKVINTCVSRNYKNTAEDKKVGERMYEAGIDGVVEYTQYITIEDNVAPVMECSSTIDTFTHTSNDCGTPVTLSVTATDQCVSSLNYRSSIDVDQDGRFFEAGEVSYTSSITADLKDGTYYAKFEVTDGCGNVSTCERTVVVIDAKKPTPICYAGLTTAVMPEGGMIELWASDFLKEAYDNCTDKAAVEASVKARIKGTEAWNDTIRITCATLASGSNVELEIGVWDASGNLDYCTTSVIVRDNGGDCPQSSSSAVASVAGLITTPQGYEIPNVEVMVNSNDRFNTAEQGGFVFSGLTKGNAYKLEAFKNDNVLNGVNVGDIVAMSQHILGAKGFESATQMIAADVDKNGSVSVSDVLYARQLILGQIESFPNNDSWRFIDASHEFASVTGALKENFNESININSLTSSDVTLDFVGVKVGDVTGNATVTNSILESRTGGVVGLNINDATLNVGQEYEMVVTAANYNEVLGQQFSVDFDASALEILDVAGNAWDVTAANFNLDNMASGSFAALYATTAATSYVSGEELFTVTVRAKEVVRLSEAFTLSNSLTESVAYVAGNGEALAANINLTFEGEEISTVFNLHQNRPNPFNGETVIGFDLPKSGTATLTVYDLNGKVLGLVNGEYAAGYNEVTLDANTLNAAGVLYYELATENHSAVKRMVVVK